MMKLLEYRKLFFLFLFYSFLTTHPVTLVYSLRVRRLFMLPEVLKGAKRKWPLSFVPIFYARNSSFSNEQQFTVREKRRVGGVVFNARYVHDKHWWAEGTTSLQTDSADYSGAACFDARATGLDDIVLSGGYRHFWGRKIQLVGYGLVGFPTKYSVDLCDKFGPLVGTRLFSLGVGSEFSYNFISELKQSLSFIFQTRFLHGFNRKWEPILPPGSKIQPGNVTDLFFILQYRYKKTVFETGYDLTFFSNQALLLPTQKIETDTYLRHSWYASVSRAFFNGKPIVIGAGISGSYTGKFDALVTSVYLDFTVVF